MLEGAREAIRKPIAAMSALQQIKVVVSSCEQNLSPLAAMEARNMQRWFDALFARRHECTSIQESAPLGRANGIFAGSDEILGFNQYAQLTGLEPISGSEWPSPLRIEAHIHEQGFESWY